MTTAIWCPVATVAKLRRKFATDQLDGLVDEPAGPFGESSTFATHVVHLRVVDDPARASRSVFRRSTSRSQVVFSQR
ncbi:hypothetical protein [Rhodococcus koreensis]